MSYGFLNLGSLHVRKIIADDLHLLILKNKGPGIQEFVNRLFTSLLNYVLKHPLCTSSTYFYFLSKIIKILDNQAMTLLLASTPKLLFKTFELFWMIEP